MTHHTSHRSFAERLKDPAPLLADGAMGTMLHGSGLPIDAAFDQLNITQPDDIRAIHAQYLQAGAELIETNTFGANRIKLAEYGLEDQVASINQAGVQRAREAIDASGREAYIAGSVGPLGMGLQPYGRLKPEDGLAVFSEQISALAEAGADAIIFETFTDLGELKLGIEAARSVAPGLPVITEMTFTADDRTIYGYLPGRVARELSEAGADVIGVNCSGGPSQISRVLAAMRESTPHAHLSAMPNAGFPQSVGGRMMYAATVEYFADYALTFRELGAQVIGGCCGTTPAHIAAMRAALDDPSRRPHIEIASDADEDERDMSAPERPSELAHMLATGQFAISVEMTPPRGHNFDKMVASARLLLDAGANVLNVADSPTARMRVSPWAACHALEQALGVETILHFPTRGRNMLRIQSDLLGAHALGLRNIFVCMGDPTRIGDYPEANDNYDIVPTGLIKLSKQRLNAGLDQAGNSIGQPTSFTVGCALNLAPDDLDKEVELTRKKLENGADFALAQPVFEPHKAEIFLERYQQVTGSALKLPVLVGVMPLYSMKHAQFLHNEVPGISIPDAIMRRIEDAGEDAAQEGVRVAQELLLALKPFAQGAYIIPSYGRYNLAAQVVEAVHVRAG